MKTLGLQKNISPKYVPYGQQASIGLDNDLNRHQTIIWRPMTA